MSFEERAHKAFQRGDTIRALVVLLAGIKRSPWSPSWQELLVKIYGDSIQSPGMEPDVVSALAPHSQSGVILGLLMYRLRLRDCHSMAEQLAKVARDARVAIVPYVPVVQLPEPAASLQENSDPQEGPSYEIGAEVSDDDADFSDNSYPEVHSEERALRDGSPKESNRDNLIPEGVVDDLVPSSGSRIARRRGKTRRFSARPLFFVVTCCATLLVIAALGYGAFSVYQHAQYASLLAKADEYIAHMDPAHIEQVEAKLEGLRWYPGGDDAIRGHHLFVRSLTPFEANQPLEPNDDEEAMPWGHVVSVLRHLQDDDLEQALTNATKIELTNSNSLAALWIRARVCEYRADLECARQQYLEATNRFQGFAPAWMGLVRVATRQLDSNALEIARQAIRELNPEHPYAVVPVLLAHDDSNELSLRLTQEDRLILQSSRVEGAKSPLSDDRFLIAINASVDSLEAIQRQDFERASETAAIAIASEQGFSLAYLLAGVVSVIQYDIDASYEHFLNALKHGRQSVALRWIVQTIAPRMYAALGRPDMGLLFATSLANHLGEFSDRNHLSPAQMAQDERVFLEAMKLPAFQHIEDIPQARSALWAKAMVLVTAGEGEQALKLFDRLAMHEEQFPGLNRQRAMTLIDNGNFPHARLVLRNVPEGIDRVVSQANLWFAEGRYEEVIALANFATQDPGLALPVEFLRPLVLSFAAMGRGREALSYLEHTDARLFDVTEIQVLKARIFARLGTTYTSAVTSIYNQLTEVQPTAVQRMVDLGAMAFWQRRVRESSMWIDRALTVNPRHPEANWFKGLMLRMEGNSTQSQHYFRRAGRTDSNEAQLLVELAYVQYDFGNYSRAQELFYRAVLRDRNNIDALGGLAKSYLSFDRRRGQRDMQRIAQSYVNSPTHRAHAGEIYKWLAILYGSRDGNPEAEKYLEIARQFLGQRADIIMEYARYLEKNDRIAEARANYTLALQKNTALPDAHFALGQLALAENKERLAKNHFERYLLLAPVGEFAADARAILGSESTPDSAH